MMGLSGTDMLGLAAFLLPNLLIRMTNFALSMAYMREKALLPTFFFFLLINIVIMYRFRRSQIGINLISSALCSLFCVVILPEDPSKKDRKGSSDVNIAVMKKVSLLITSISLPLVFLISWSSYLLVVHLSGLKTDPNILFTFDQYWYIMSRTFTGLFILSTISCGWFALTYDKPTQGLRSGLKMIGDVIIIFSTLGLLIGSVAQLPSGPNAVVLTEERGTGLYLRYGYTYQNISSTLQCNLGNQSKWLCGQYELKNAQNHHNLITEDSHIVYLGNELSLQDKGKVIKLFPLQSKELETELGESECVTCVSQSSQCKKIERNFDSCENFCTTYPTNKKLIKKVKIDQKYIAIEDLQEDTISSPYTVGESVEIQSVCTHLRNSFITCLGNNEWKIPGCKKGREEIKYHPSSLWTSWGPWSSCLAGLMRRTRGCRNSSPRNGGNPCSGSEKEEMPCSSEGVCQCQNNFGI